ncbi:hypothetical protein D3C77_598570 [compost metagenome]
MLLVRLGAQGLVGFYFAVDVHVAALLRRLLIQLSGQRQVAHCLGLLGHPAKASQAIGTVGDWNVARLFPESGPAFVEVLLPLLRQVAPRVLGGVVPLAQLTRDLNPVLILDGLRHLSRCIEAGQSLNNKGLHLIFQGCHRFGFRQGLSRIKPT